MIPMVISEKVICANIINKNVKIKVDTHKISLYYSFKKLKMLTSYVKTKHAYDDLKYVYGIRQTNSYYELKLAGFISSY